MSTSFRPPSLALSTVGLSLATFAAGLKGAGKLLFSTRERELLWGGSGVSKLGTNRPEFTKRSLRGLMSASPCSRQRTRKINLAEICLLMWNIVILLDSQVGHRAYA